jgi:hypothetical protein
MSSIFSDPFFRRGSTLLSGDAIEVDPAGVPVAGTEIVGQVKVFQDVNPVGRGERYSNRLVYCIAARYTPLDNQTKINVAGADKGKWYVLSRRNGLATFADLASATDITDGRTVGVLDEYLNEEVRPNDIVWLVVKGPASAAKGNTVVIPGGLGVEIASGLTVTKATQANMVGQSVDAAAPYTGTASNASTALTVTSGAGIAVGMPVSGTGIAAGTHVSAVSGTSVTLSANTTAAITAGTVFIGGPLRAATTCRVNVHNAAI